MQTHVMVVEDIEHSCSQWQALCGSACRYDCFS